MARRKLARLIAEGNTSREEAQRPETFEEAARRVLDEQKAAGMVTHKDRLYRLETYAFPTLAKIQSSAIKAAHVGEVPNAVGLLGGFSDSAGSTSSSIARRICLTGPPSSGFFGSGRAASLRGAVLLRNRGSISEASGA